MPNDYSFDDENEPVTKKKKVKKIKKAKETASKPKDKVKSKDKIKTKTKDKAKSKDKVEVKKDTGAKRGRPSKNASTGKAAKSSAYVPPKISAKADKLAYLTENLKRNFIADWLEANKSALEKGKDFKAIKVVDDTTFFASLFNEMFMAYRKSHKPSSNKAISAAMAASNANGYSALDAFVNSLSK